MGWPLFSLSKSRRFVPVRYETGKVHIHVDAGSPLGLASIWDVDLLIWITSQSSHSRKCGIIPPRTLIFRPGDVLAFANRGTGKASHERLRAALTRLCTTSVQTSLRCKTLQRFCWIEQWTQHRDPAGRCIAHEVTLSDWLHDAVCESRQILAIAPEYFDMTSGFERWLYRLVRKHGGHQRNGWSFDLPHLHARSGALSSCRRFGFELRRIVRSQALPGYHLDLRSASSSERFGFRKASHNQDDLTVANHKFVSLDKRCATCG